MSTTTNDDIVDHTPTTNSPSTSNVTTANDILTTNPTTATPNNTNNNNILTNVSTTATDETTNTNDNDSNENDDSNENGDNAVTREPSRHLEVYGLQQSTNGRSCDRHSYCGDVVEVGDILAIKSLQVTTTQGDEAALGCYLIEDGIATCLVGFIPRFLLSEPMFNCGVSVFLLVVDLFWKSASPQKRRKSHQNCGVIGCIILKELPNNRNNQTNNNSDNKE